MHPHRGTQKLYKRMYVASCLLFMPNCLSTEYYHFQHFRFLADRTVRSVNVYMIGFWHNNLVRLSLWLSVCLFLTLCMVA